MISSEVINKLKFACSAECQHAVSSQMDSDNNEAQVVFSSASKSFDVQSAHDRFNTCDPGMPESRVPKTTHSVALLPSTGNPDRFTLKRQLEGA